MAQRVMVVDDITGEEFAETVSFTVNGKSYEIDLAAPQRELFDKALATFIEHARNAAPVVQQSAKPGRAPRPGQSDKREQAQAARDWARSQGISVAERGRVPSGIMDGYLAAQGGSAPTIPDTSKAEQRKLTEDANRLLREAKDKAVPPALFSASEEQSHPRVECPDLDNCPTHSEDKPAEDKKPQIIEVTAAGIAAWMKQQGMDPAGIKFLKRLSLFKQGHPGVEVKYMKESA